MDAFTHNVEVYLANGFHPICDVIALGGARMVYEHLPRVMRDPNDMESRGQMMAAAMMGAIAIQKGLGAAHSLAHPLSREFGMHHYLGKDVTECTRDILLSLYRQAW